jgi:hypothetical protein
MNETEKYFWEWYNHCEATGECVPLCEWLNTKYSHLDYSFDYDKDGNLLIVHKMKKDLNMPTSIIPEQPPVLEPEQDRMETIILRDNAGRKFSEVRMTHSEFVEIHKPLFDTLERIQQKNEYRGW